MKRVFRVWYSVPLILILLYQEKAAQFLNLMELLCAVVGACLMLTMTACASPGQGIKIFDQSKIVLLQTEEMVEGEDIAVVETSEGSFKMRFFPSEAPKTVENFIELANAGYFDGQKVSRVERVEEESDTKGRLIAGSGKPVEQEGASIYEEPIEPELSYNLGTIPGAVLAYAPDGVVDSRFYIVGSREVCEEEIEEIDVDQLIAYLKRSHLYYLDNRLAAIEQKLNDIGETCPVEHRQILNRFFEGYKNEVISHFEYEERTVFPYILDVTVGSRPKDYRIEVFKENHSNIDDKLNDLKNIIMKYLQGSARGEEKINLLFDIFSLEEDLSKHSLIEDKILVPFVLKLEQRYDKE